MSCEFPSLHGVNLLVLECFLLERISCCRGLVPVNFFPFRVNISLGKVVDLSMLKYGQLIHCTRTFRTLVKLTVPVKQSILYIHSNINGWSIVHPKCTIDCFTCSINKLNLLMLLSLVPMHDMRYQSVCINCPS